MKMEHPVSYNLQKLALALENANFLNCLRYVSAATISLSIHGLLWSSLIFCFEKSHDLEQAYWI